MIKLGLTSAVQIQVLLVPHDLKLQSKNLAVQKPNTYESKVMAMSQYVQIQLLKLGTFEVLPYSTLELHVVSMLYVINDHSAINNIIKRS